jgi:uncharacterized protein (DUF488 family)
MILTIGHSTRTLEQLVALLKLHGVRQLADVRTIPRSRRNPQFNRQTLAAELQRAGILYIHLPGLGGLRRPNANSPLNAGWRSAGFRGYADYMQTPEFEQHIEQLLVLAKQKPLAVMCAEAVPWRCHRSLVADAMVARGVEVRHILGEKPASPHTLTKFARVDGTRVTYPPASPELPFPQRPRS